MSEYKYSKNGVIIDKRESFQIKKKKNIKEISLWNYLL